MKPVLAAILLVAAIAPRGEACICVCEEKPRSIQVQVKDSSAVVVAEVIDKIERETLTRDGET